MTFVPFRWLLDRLTLPQIFPLARLPLHANHWTLIGGVVGMFGSAEFIIYFGLGLLGEAVANPGWSLLAGCWAVAIVSHVSLLQRLFFAWRRYRDVDPESDSNREP